LKRILIVLLILATPLLAQTRRRSSHPGDAIPVFVFDSGFRVVNATNPAPGVDPATGQVWIYYVDQILHKTMLRTSNDGLTFGAATEPSSWKDVRRVAAIRQCLDDRERDDAVSTEDSYETDHSCGSHSCDAFGCLRGGHHWQGIARVVDDEG
jgi:hypothetical protein